VNDQVGVALVVDFLEALSRLSVPLKLDSLCAHVPLE
jgi:hypothetical protein